MDQLELDRNPWAKAADLIEERGWIKGTEVNERGEVCIEGAVRLCAPQPGDGAIYREVVAYRQHGASWNDADERTADEVLAWLRTQAWEITDDELEAVFGPDWEHVVALVRRAASLTDAERQTYYDAVTSVWGTSEWSRAWRAVIVLVGPGGAALRALGAVGVGAGAALARRHEIGVPGGIRQEDYDVLVKPWVSLFGPVHPADAVAVSA